MIYDVSDCGIVDYIKINGILYSIDIYTKPIVLDLVNTQKYLFNGKQINIYFDTNDSEYVFIVTEKLSYKLVRRYKIIQNIQHAYPIIDDIYVNEKKYNINTNVNPILNFNEYICKLMDAIKLMGKTKKIEYENNDKIISINNQMYYRDTYILYTLTQRTF
jgi:hypothetical protein